MTEADVQAFVNALAPVIKNYVQRSLEPVTKRLDGLEERGSLEYRGIFEDSTVYRKGDLVTRDGSLWIAKSPTHERPGASSDWQLCVKRGQNGRDAK